MQRGEKKKKKNLLGDSLLYWPPHIYTAKKISVVNTSTSPFSLAGSSNKNAQFLIKRAVFF